MKRLALTLLLIAALSQPAYAFFGRKVQGTAQAANGAADATVITAPGAGKVTSLKRGICAVEVIATGGGGEFALEDGVGGTRIIQADADALGVYPFDFGDEGYNLTANTLLNITVDGAATTQATASCSVIAEIKG